MAHRLEITLQDDTLAALDEARGHEPRAAFVKRALAAMLPVRGAGILSREPSRAELEALDADLLAGEQMRNGAPVVAPTRRAPAAAAVPMGKGYVKPIPKGKR